MVELNQLIQLIELDRAGTLSKAAASLHLTQPALSRSMQRLEEELGVSLFERTGNRLYLNENGKLAVHYAGQIVQKSCEMKHELYQQDLKLRTIFVGACAPYPNRIVMQKVYDLYPDMKKSSEISSIRRLMEGLQDGTYQVIILNEEAEDPSLYCQYLFPEHLCFLLPKDHPLAGRKSLRFADMDGETMLVFSRIGIWDEIHRVMMPHSRFILHESHEVVDEVGDKSSFPMFFTFENGDFGRYKDRRVAVPIEDEAATQHFYVAVKNEDRKRFEPLLKALRTL